MGQETGKHLCQCGCGQTVTVRAAHYPNVPRFLHGHNMRVKPARGTSKPQRRLCACGCGELANYGKRFISGHNSKGRKLSEETRARMSEEQRGSRSHWFGKRGAEAPGFKTGTTRTAEGYLRVAVADHPFGRGATSYVMAHRLAIEEHLRDSDPDSPWLVEVDGDLYLDPGVEVHHKDGDRANNALENLEVLTKGDHARLHAIENNPNARPKTHCKHGHPFDQENTYITPSGRRNCRICRRAAVLKYQQRMS